MVHTTVVDQLKIILWEVNFWWILDISRDLTFVDKFKMGRPKVKMSQRGATQRLEHVRLKAEDIIILTQLIVYSDTINNQDWHSTIKIDRLGVRKGLNRLRPKNLPIDRSSNCLIEETSILIWLKEVENHFGHILICEASKRDSLVGLIDSNDHYQI